MEKAKFLIVEDQGIVGLDLKTKLEGLGPLTLSPARLAVVLGTR
jgi:hypothetical protein